MKIIYRLALGALTVLFALSVNATTAKNLDCQDQCGKVFGKLKKHASYGSPQAQTLLALAYKSGEGGEVDYDAAWRWMRRAHRQAFPPALHITSQWFREGFHTDVNIIKANEFLQRAVVQEFGPAILDLGILQYKNDNLDAAFEMFNKAADMGSLKARAILKQQQKLQTQAQEQIQQNPTENSLLSLDKNKQLITENTDLDFENDSETITIIGKRDEPMTLFFNLLQDISDVGFYNQRGSTGSRVSDRKCTGRAQGSNQGCKLVYSRNRDGNLM